MAALMWVSYEERSLRANELSEALEVELGSADFNIGKVPSMSTLAATVRHIVVDKEESTARVILLTPGVSLGS